jgi:hypothetical protein
MAEEAAVKQPAEEVAGNENLQNDASQAVEGEGQNSTGPANDVKQEGKQGEVSPYQKQLDELKAANSKKDEIIEKKNRALEAEKTKRKEAEANKKSDETEDQRMERVADQAAERRYQKGALDNKIKAFTSDPVEQEVIRKHYEQSIQQTGNLETDFERAVAIANSKLAMEQRNNDTARKDNQDLMTGFQNSSMRGSSPSKFKSAARTMAESLLETIASNSADGKVNGINVREAMKNLDKYL